MGAKVYTRKRVQVHGGRTMSLLEAVKELAKWDHVIYQDVSKQYHFFSGVVTYAFTGSEKEAGFKLLSTDLRVGAEQPRIYAINDMVFYKVPVELFIGDMSEDEIRAIIDKQNGVMLPEALQIPEIAGMYPEQVLEQLADLKEFYVAPGEMPKVEVMDVSHLLE